MHTSNILLSLEILLLHPTASILLSGDIYSGDYTVAYM